MNEYETVSKSVKIDVIDGLKDGLPQIFEDGKVNLEKLKALLTGKIVEKEDDRFYFNWAGKSKLFKLIQERGYGTLKPDKEQSVDFDNTENMVIVGENLETLKLLLKPYFGKVKMIYIDPPYNTGKDFIYRDNFKEPLKDYLEKTGQIDSEGSKLTTNTEASGRYHSDWLNFMYPRLFLARSLLRDDGVIFVSIDDHEVHNLRKIMDEIFGEENFVGQLIVKSNPRGSQESFGISAEHEYVLCYAKGESGIYSIVGYERGEEDAEFTFIGENGKKARLLGLRKRGGDWRRSDRPDMYYPFYVNPVTQKVSLERNPEHSIEVYPVRPDGEESRWTWGEQTAVSRMRELIAKEIKRNGKTVFDVYRIDYLENEEGIRKRKKLKSILEDKELNYQHARQYFKILFGTSELFDFPKPPELIRKLMGALDENDYLILDFFAGSGTTGQAVWDLNKEDGGNRKVILVNLDEEVQDENIKKEFPTVADICIERLKRVSEKYKKEEKGKLTKSDQDLGFKVFRLDKSNFNLKDEFEISEGEDAEELKKRYLEWLGLWINEPLVGDWKPIDVVYETMLKEGFDLNSKIEEMKIKGNKFSHVIDEEQRLEFYMSLDEKISDEAIEEIRTPEYRDKVFVFLDKALSDNDKINLSAFVRLKVI
ncbi:MAG: site-specific DNA-methyltransferase [Methanophagales archaeon]|nr:site-specific DNA-methyltransferase [Methanophagales archaeon]